MTDFVVDKSQGDCIVQPFLGTGSNSQTLTGTEDIYWPGTGDAD